MNKTLKRLIVTKVITPEQEARIEHLLGLGYEFHSLFKDGSVELTAGEPKICSILYIEKDGEIKQI